MRVAAPGRDFHARQPQPLVRAGAIGREHPAGKAREALLHAARQPAADQVLLEEVLALRTILLNLQFAVAAGTPPNAEDMHQLIHRADADKAQKALDRLTSAVIRRSR